MTLYDQIISAYPELVPNDFDPSFGVIHLRNDSDGSGDYIAKWNYSKPIPAGMVVGKPNE